MGAHFGVSCAGIAWLFCAMSLGAAPAASHSLNDISKSSTQLSDRNPLLSPRPEPPALFNFDPSDDLSLPPQRPSNGPQDVIVKSPPALIPALGVLALLVIWRRYGTSRGRRMAFNVSRRGR